MSSKHHFKRTPLDRVLFALCFTLVAGIAHADKHIGTLAVRPARCIGLQQGQVCFAKLKFTWSTPASGDFCLHDERSADPLVCWIGRSKTTYSAKFESNTNVIYEIRLKNSSEAIAQTLVKVSWVYKSNNSSTSRWRLF